MKTLWKFSTKLGVTPGCIPVRISGEIHDLTTLFLMKSLKFGETSRITVNFLERFRLQLLEKNLMGTPGSIRIGMGISGEDL